MIFEHSEKVKALVARLEAFMDAHIYPNEDAHHEWVNDPVRLWQYWPGLDALKAEAKSQGLWNLFLPHE